MAKTEKEKQEDARADKFAGDPDAVVIIGTTKTVKVERDEPK